MQLYRALAKSSLLAPYLSLPIGGPLAQAERMTVPARQTKVDATEREGKNILPLIFIVSPYA